MNLSDIKRVADLSNLEFSEDQSACVLDKLKSIFLMIEKMKSLDTKEIEPLNHPIEIIQKDLSMRLRSDKLVEVENQEDYQNMAPAIKNGLYLVPKVI